MSVPMSFNCSSYNVESNPKPCPHHLVVDLCGQCIKEQRECSGGVNSAHVCKELKSVWDGKHYPYVRHRLIQ